MRLKSGQHLKQAGVITSDCRSSLLLGLVLRTLTKMLQSSKNHLIFPKNCCKNRNITFQKSMFWALFYSRYLYFFPECCGVVLCSEMLSNVILFLSPGFEYRLRELCKDLLGPVHYSAGSQWESTVMVSPDNSLMKNKGEFPIKITGYYPFHTLL